MSTSGDSGSEELERAQTPGEIVQSKPDFADIARRQAVLNSALEAEGEDFVRALADLRVEGLDTYNLSWLDLPQRDLRGFSGDRLRAQKLVFTLADMRRANLNGSNFEAAVGTRAWLNEAQLDASEWKAAILTGADMRDVSARGASFVDTVMNGVDFTGADLRGARFIGTHLINVIGLDEARTEGAVFRGARMIDEAPETETPESLESMRKQAVLTQMLTAPVDRQESAYERARERGLIIGPSIIKAVGLEVSNLLLPDMRAEDLLAQGLILVETDFTGSDFTGANFDRAIGTRAKLRGVRLGGVTLRGAILSGVDMVEAWAPGADFTGADLSGADVTGANLAGAIFDRTNLEGIVGLDDAITSGLVIKDVYRSSSSQLPELEQPSE